MPANAPRVTWEVAETDTKARDGAAIRKRVVGRMGDRPDAPRMNLTMYLPARANGPVPVLLSISFGFGAGGRGQAAGKAAAPRKSEGPGKPARLLAAAPGDSIPSARCSSRGWGYASLPYSEIQPDRADRWTEGVIGLTLKPGQARPAPDEWGTISAWAWGISRAIDYLETDRAVNPKQIAITGVSRLGKTVLWAGAQDERVAAVFSVVSGEMGAALIRRDWGETLDDMAQNFPWQFAGNLQKWAGRWNDLPVDQHMLIALCAPRPVYVNGGLTDQWSDPKGEFLAMVAAGPVYRLLGTEGPGRHRTAAARHAGHRRRPGLPLSQRWAHGGPGRLEGVPRIRRSAFPRPRGEIAVRPALSTVMLLAVDLWAAARSAGLPTGAAEASDGDCILAAQALMAAIPTNTVTVAADNVAHLSRFVDVRS